MKPTFITATLATGEPTTIRADLVAYIHAKNDVEGVGCHVGFAGMSWMVLADSFEMMDGKLRQALAER